MIVLVYAFNGEDQLVRTVGKYGNDDGEFRSICSVIFYNIIMITFM